MVILHFRVSLCYILGSILSWYFWVLFGRATTGSTGPVFTGPPNYGNTGFFVAQTVFSSTTTVGFQLPSPSLQGH